jgi:outer membrane lipoprotein carrier protein
MANLMPIRFLASAILLAACGGAPDVAADHAANPAAETTTVSHDPAQVAATTSAAGEAAALPSQASSPAQQRATGAAADSAAGRSSTAGDAGAIAGAGDTGEAADQARTQEPTALLSRTSAAYSGIRSMQAEFAMVTTNPLLHSTVRSRGTLFQHRPDRILLRFTEPKGDIILGDGRYFWVYYPSVDAQQVTRTSAANASGVVDLQAQFVGDPLKRFEHTFNGRETVQGRETAIFTLVPREDPGYRVLKVWIDTKDYLVRRFEVTDNSGIVRRLDLTDLDTNPAMPDDLFRFTPPPGAKIVERG